MNNPRIDEIIERMHIVAGGRRIGKTFYPSTCTDDRWANEVSQVASRLEHLANNFETARDSSFFGGPLTQRELAVIKHFM